MCRLCKRLICLLLVLGCIWGMVPGGQAAMPDIPDEIFLTQEGNGTCTLCSAAMMIRSCLYIHGNDDWSQVTQKALKNTAWIDNLGLKWNFRYATESCAVQVGYQGGLDGISVADLKAVLDQHPEGIVLYCKSVPHGVFLFGYEGDVFYCAETVKGYSEEKITLAESWMGKKAGSQEALLKKVSAYWYVSSYEAFEVESCDCREEFAGVYKVTTKSSPLTIRGGHGTGYTVVGRLPKGAEVTVTKASGTGEDDWAHVIYDGVSGYASMKYLTKVGEQHRYESVVRAPTCLEPGATVHTCVDCGHSYEDTPVAPLGHRFGTWSQDAASGKEVRECARCGETEQRDAAVMGTITGNKLRIRSGPGTGYETLGHLMKGDRVEILEQKTVGSSAWGRIEKGWISMTYVVLDTPGTEPPTTEPPTTEPPTTEPNSKGIMGTVTTNVLRVRSGPGTEYLTLDRVRKGDRVQILEMEIVGGVTWGKIDRGWISLDYVELDKPEEDAPAKSRIVTVDTYCLRVRSEPGVGHKIVGYLYLGAKVEITEEKTVEGVTWGKTDQGWISLQYVK